MATLPGATTTISNTAGAYSGGSGYACIIAPVGTNADASAPRVYTSLASLYSQHAFSAGVDLAAMLFEECKVPVLFVGVPIVTASTVGTRRTGSSNTGTTQYTVSGTYLDQLDVVLTCTTAGTIGTAPGPSFTLSLDGGRTSKTIRLKTATSYAIPYVGATIAFTSGCTMAEGDTFSFRTTQPLMDNTGLTAARTALAAQQKVVREIMVVGDLTSSTDAGYVTTQMNAYETSNKRFVYARAQVPDGGPCAPQAKSSGQMVRANFSAAETLTFAEVGATGDTVTRSVGSWITDGFAVGDVVTFAGSVSNNVTGRIAALTATILTFDTTDLINEGPTVALGTISCVGSNGFIFAEVGATGDTITRNAGSWILDGFAVGDLVTITGTASNNMTTDAITGVSATVLTLGSSDLTAEEIGSHNVTIVKSQTKAAHVAAQDAAFASVDAQKRIDLGYGRARKLSPVLGAKMRRPVQWAAMLREFKHDLHIPCWRVLDGPLDGWDLEDTHAQLVEYDERVDGGALAARFTCFTTQDNGPNGAFIGLSLTRDTEGSLLSRTHNLAVANKACSITQAETTAAVGTVLVLNSDGTGSESSLKAIEGRVNKALQIGLLQAGAEGQLASSAKWVASRSDILNVASPTLNGTLSLLLNGTLEHIATSVQIQTGG